MERSPLANHRVQLYERMPIVKRDSATAGSGTLHLAHINGGLTFRVLSDRKFDAISLGQAAKPLRDDGAVMDKHVISGFAGDETVTFLVVEPLDNPGFASVFSHLPVLLLSNAKRV